MQSHCPHCGKEVQGKSPTAQAADILFGIMEKVGGPKAFGQAIAEDWEAAGGHQRVLLTNKIVNLAESVDKAEATRKFREDLTASEERGALIEYALVLIKEDKDFRKRVISAIHNRKLLPDHSDVIDAEFETLSD